MKRLRKQKQRHLFARKRIISNFLLLVPTISMFFSMIFVVFPFSLNLKLEKIEHYFFPANLELYMNDKLRLKDINSTKECKLCSFNVHNTLPNSTPRDVVICNAIRLAKNMVIFVKTLRTTGSKARCVFLLDSHAFSLVSPATKAIISNCGGQIIDCGYVPYHKRLDGHNYCFVFSAYFIEKNRDKFDRVIISDMYDTAFQGDPFNEQLSGDELNIVDEGSNFTTPPGKKNVDWLKAFNFTIPPERMSEYHICTGYIGGKTEVVLKALKIYLQQHIFGLERHDQAAFNFLYFSGIFKQNGIEISKERQNELVRHLSYINLGSHSSIGDARTIRNESAFASVIHHYYLNEEFQKSLLRYCPRESKNLERYLGKADEDKTRAWENEIKIENQPKEKVKKNDYRSNVVIKIPKIPVYRRPRR